MKRPESNAALSPTSSPPLSAGSFVWNNELQDSKHPPDSCRDSCSGDGLPSWLSPLATMLCRDSCSKCGLPYRECTCASCHVCAKTFNVFKRRHHCRSCWQPVCGGCSAQKLRRASQSRATANPRVAGVVAAVSPLKCRVCQDSPPPSGNTAREGGALPEVPGYTAVKLIGTGSVADVYAAVCDITGETVALKVMDKQALRKLGISDASISRMVLRETRALARLRSCANVLQLHGVHASANQVVLVLELLASDLHSEIARQRQLSEPVAREVLRGLATAIQHIHSAGMVHADIKPENILINTRPDPTLADQHLGGAVAQAVEVRLADFGLMCNLSDLREGSSLVGTREYQAPETVRGGTLSTSTDMWAVGITLHVALFGRLPSRAEGTHLGPVQLASAGTAVSGNVERLLCALLSEKPSQRPTAAEVLAHPWLHEEAMPS